MLTGLSLNARAGSWALSYAISAQAGAYAFGNTVVRKPAREGRAHPEALGVHS